MPSDSPMLSFDLQAYSVDAVQRALYRMSDRLAGELAVDHEGMRITCVLTTEAGEPVTPARIAEFRNEVLDEVLRERVRNETAEIRNLVLAVAFSKSGLVEPDRLSDV